MNILKLSSQYLSYPPPFAVMVQFPPSVVLGNGVERLHTTAFGTLHYRRYELLQKA
jgi:hypothetical protein